MRLTRSGNRRVKIIIASLCTAPLLVGAIVTVASGGAGASGRLAADSPVAPSPGAGLNSGEFDELTMIVPQRPGVDGRIGSDKPARADVPVQGATDGRSVVRPGRPGAVNGIPRGVFPAYRRATANLAVVRPDCGLTWPLLAGIGKVESAHASGGKVDVAGTTRGKILGPVLNGRGETGRVKDTDKGRFDGELTWDRAVGPMQIIPGVWEEFGADGNGDGFRNPNNVYDAVTTVAVYLCSEGDDLKRPRDLIASLLRYQHSKDFVATVLRWMRVYSKSAVLLPNAKGNLAAPKMIGNADRKTDPRAVPEVPDDKASPTAKPSVPATKPTLPDPIDTPARPTTRPTRPPTDKPTPTPSDTPTPKPTPTPTPTPTPSDTPSGSPCAAETNPTPCTQGSGSHG
ncbi:membrane-bound lytic murein transglycosylase B [Kribbella orskensis]|uniref:Membrane-bound lytic murein transglycosylase B n=1 Tax=Kribbella orskensis TaxID=2512216 RepID=A0ABY2BFX5_9ACTN|nr:membrane-bound lytic murein transglycosylase B [Kribbella sp. VKM Ac-2500]TCO18899.1 membrane-bound lytic murein transglycosylase B [Kribbella orskensis]